MNTFICNRAEDVKHVVDIFCACVVLHNLLISYNDMVPQEWYEDLAENMDFDLMDEHENEHTVGDIGKKESSRRTVVFNAIVESYCG